MARIMLDGTEIAVVESLEDVLGRLVVAKDGMRSSDGKMFAPPGWITLRETDTGENLYVQTDRLGYVRAD